MTAERLTERELQAHCAVSQALREWESFEEGVVDLLRDAAVAVGVHPAVAFPAVAPDGPLAVLSLYPLEKRVLRPSLIRTLTGIGRELGRFHRAAQRPGGLRGATV